MTAHDKEYRFYRISQGKSCKTINMKEGDQISRVIILNCLKCLVSAKNYKTYTLTYTHTHTHTKKVWFIHRKKDVIEIVLEEAQMLVSLKTELAILNIFK